MSRLEKRIGRTQKEYEEELDGEPNDCRVRKQGYGTCGRGHG